MSSHRETKDRTFAQARAACRFSAALLVILLILSTGCRSARYLSNRDVRANPLAAPLKLMTRQGPSVSERTWNTLRRYGLRETYDENTHLCLNQLRAALRENRDGELIHALSELSYVEGKKAEQAGRNGDAINHYGFALTQSYDYLFSDDLRETRNQYDPQFRATCDLYNESLEDTLRLLCREKRITPGQTYRIKTDDREFVVRTEMRGKWRNEDFERYEFVSDFEIQKLRNRHTTYGLGVPLVAVRKPAGDSDPRENYYPEGLSYAVTALMRCSKPTMHRGEEINECVLEFFDPLSANQVRLADNWVPLETDLTTPLAYFLDNPKFRERNAELEGLINPANAEKNRGLYMLEPYDPNRIPVLMVHGLWSSPRTWMDMFNDLRSFPEIRERYQFWFYLYPSGQPFWLSATQLRNDLAKMRKAFDADNTDRSLDKMVLVGHSMGGLISRMQTIDSGDDFWQIVSDEPPTKLKGPDEQRNKLVSTLYFKPNRSVARVITIGTPHQGSKFANDFTRWLARKLIELPNLTRTTGETLVNENPGFFHDTELLTMANAIDSLAPDSPIFPAMHRARYDPNVKFHNIIGVLEDPSLWQRRAGEGDGVVHKKSAQTEDAVSELVVDADHTTIHMTGKAIFEVRRILLEHLNEVDSHDRVAGRQNAPVFRVTSGRDQMIEEDKSVRSR